MSQTDDICDEHKIASRRKRFHVEVSQKSVSENRVSLTVSSQLLVEMRRTSRSDPTRISCRQRNYAQGGAANSSRRNKFVTCNG
jgi:hypothetical protein